jgi:hypothetical protein
MYKLYFPAYSLLGKHCTPHTKEAHKRYLKSKSLISRLTGQEKNGSAASLGE